jgi:hypothetical protein
MSRANCSGSWLTSQCPPDTGGHHGGGDDHGGDLTWGQPDGPEGEQIAAAVADPGVVDVSEAMTSQLPGSMKKQLDEGKQDSFDSRIHLVERFSKSLRYTMKFRSLPYGTESPYEMFKRAGQYRLDLEAAKQIRCPLLITDPEHEQFWPGHSKRLAELVGPSATLIPFTAEEGGDGHCEPRAPALRAQRIFDWLDEQLGVPRG